MSQVKFLGLVHTFATVSPSNVQLNPLQKGMDTQVEIKILLLYRKCYVIADYRSHNLIGPYHFLEICPRNSTRSLDLSSQGGVHELHGHETSRSLATSIADSEKLASFPGPRPASRRLQYGKRREAGRGPGNEASQLIVVFGMRLVN